MFRFTALFLLFTLLSALLHEAGHCLFYWAQGIPAGMSLVKEYPLRDITDLEYAVGSAGGPLSNLAQLVLGFVWVSRAKAGSRSRVAGVAFLLANVFYFLIRGGLALLKGEGGELTDAGSLIGLPFQGAIILFFLISIATATWMQRTLRYPIARTFAFRLPVLLLLYFVFLIALETADRALFWERFPTVEIGDGRLYNEHRP
ncbi:MAG: hypothetical protein ACWGSQ_14625 [Longimicrobiales bacterium]